MHGNTQVTPSGVKTRDFDDILREVELTFDVHEGCGTHLGGVHFEMTGEDVTECIGGAAGITVDDLDKNYASACDPRLNYRQSPGDGLPHREAAGQALASLAVYPLGDLDGVERGALAQIVADDK
jgi:hypothetical protein